MADPPSREERDRPRSFFQNVPLPAVLRKDVALTKAETLARIDKIASLRLFPGYDEPNQNKIQPAHEHLSPANTTDPSRRLYWEIVVSGLAHSLILLLFIVPLTPKKQIWRGMPAGSVVNPIEMIFQGQPSLKKENKTQKKLENQIHTQQPQLMPSPILPRPVTPLPPLHQQKNPSKTSPMSSTSSPAIPANPDQTKNGRQSSSYPLRHTSPFDRMQPLDLSQSPQSNHQKKNAVPKRKNQQGLDVSVGPMVKNGKFNIPYATQPTIKGLNYAYGTEIENWIRDHVYYPEEAAKAGEDGSPLIQVRLARSGRVLQVNLVHSSGYYRLDSSLLAVFRGAHLPPVPPDMEGDHFDFTLNMNYILITR